MERNRAERKSATLGELAELVGGRVEGDPGLPIFGLNSLEEAGEGEITFLAEAKHLPRLEGTRASAVILPPSLPASSRPAIRSSNPYLAYAKIQAFFTARSRAPWGIDPRAHIGREVQMGREVSVFPFVYIGDRCTVGDRVVLHPGVYLGEEVEVGEESLLYPNVVVRERCRIGKRVIIHSGAVIGSDGFGFAPDGSRQVKIPQVGIVRVDDDVEIGANCAIDRAAMGQTWIQRGVKMDNLIQIGHNVVVGEDTLLVAQVGISGSTRVGREVAIGGQAGVVGHATIGDGAKVGAQSGVIGDLKAGEVVSGTPAFAHREWLKAQVVLPKLPEIKRVLAQLEKKVRSLEETMGRFGEGVK